MAWVCSDCKLFWMRTVLLGVEHCDDFCPGTHAVLVNFPYADEISEQLLFTRAGRAFCAGAQSAGG